MSVDDSFLSRQTILDFISKTKKEREYQLFSASDGHEAYTVLDDEPDMSIIFLDWCMPKMDGKQFIEKIRQDNRFNKVRVIVVSEECNKHCIPTEIKKEINGFIVKPFTQEKIETMTKQLLARL